MIAHESALPRTGMPPCDVNDLAANRRLVADRHDAVAGVSERACACLAELLAERDEVERALIEGRAEQEMGVPCLAMTALQARRDSCQERIDALLAAVVQLDAQHEGLGVQAGAPTSTDR